MYDWEIALGKKVVPTRSRLVGVGRLAILVIEEWPIHGIFYDFVKCTTPEGEILHFRPEELLPEEYAHKQINR